MGTPSGSVCRQLVGLAVLAATVLGVAACGASTTPSPSPPSSSSAAPSPVSPSPSPLPEPSPSPTPCPSLPSTLDVPSTHLVAIVLREDVGPADLMPITDDVEFRFEARDASPGGPPSGRIEIAEPAFVQDPSGLPLDVAGERFLRIRFEGMVLYDDSGTPTRTTAEPISGTEPGIVAVARESEFEGVSSWILGIDGPGCVTAWTADDGLGLVIAIEP